MNKVFVVHGRNLNIKNSMFKFLMSLGLEPIEWETAVAEEEQATPELFDVIIDTIKNCDAVIILMTSDDKVSLRNELGIEPEGFQPRPNVVFEAGIALANKGKEKTLLVKFSSQRSISDIGGLNYIFLNDEPQNRQAFVSRLITAGLAPKKNGSNYLNVDFTGSFLEFPNTELENKCNDVLSEKKPLYGSWDKCIVDSVITHHPDDLDLHEEFIAKLQQDNIYDLKYNYIGNQCAKYWLDLSGDPSYGHSRLINMYQEHTIELVQRMTEHENCIFDYISLGSGDGIIDNHVITALQAKYMINCYYPFDISMDLLQKSVNFVTTVPYLKTDKIKAIHGDFSEITKFKKFYYWPDAKKVFCLAGFTFGNYDEHFIIRRIAAGIEEGDYLIIDARIHDYENIDIKVLNSKEEKDKIIFHYSSAFNNRFAFGPIEQATYASLETANIQNIVDNDITTVPNAINVKTVIPRLDTKLRIRYKSHNKIQINKSITLASTTIYSYKDLYSWICEHGFEIIHNVRKENIVLFLLRKST